MPPRQEVRIEAHLRSCDSCRLNHHRLCAALAEVRRHTQAPQPQTLASVLPGIRRWEAGRSDPKRCGAALKQRVAAEIGPFLGHRAANRLLQIVPEEGQNLLSTIEPVLAHFLGSRAASDLISHVVDAAIVRI